MQLFQRQSFLIIVLSLFSSVSLEFVSAQKLAADEENPNHRREFLYWFARMEQFETFTFHAELHLRKSINRPLGPNRQYRYWRHLDNERALEFYDMGIFDADSGRLRNGSPAVLDWRWNGSECLEVSVDKPFDDRLVKIGVASLIDYSVYNWKSPRSLENDWPVWLRPDVVGAISLPPRDYADVATLIRKLKEHPLAEPHLELFEVHIPVMSNWDDKSNIRHLWWMDPQKGYAPVKFQTSYQAHGGTTTRTYTVTSWYEFADESFWFPKEYVEEFADDDNGKMEVFAIQDVKVIDCHVNCELPDLLFSIEFLPGIPVHSYDEENMVVRAFMVRNDQTKAIVYEAAATPNEERGDAITTFIKTNKDDPSFSGKFSGYQHLLTDWSVSTSLPNNSQQASQETAKLPSGRLSLWYGVMSLVVLGIAVYVSRQLLNSSARKVSSR